MRRLVALLLGVFMAWLGTAAPSDAVAAPLAQVHVYAYDSIVSPAPSTDAASERGPPATDVRSAVYDADGLRPLGAFARPDRGAIARTYGYDGAQPRVGIVRGSKVVERLSGNGRAEPVAVTRWRVAAEGGMAGVRAAGRTGEELAGIVKNTEHIPSAVERLHTGFLTN